MDSRNGNRVFFFTHTSTSFYLGIIGESNPRFLMRQFWCQIITSTTLVHVLREYIAAHFEFLIYSIRTNEILSDLCIHGYDSFFVWLKSNFIVLDHEINKIMKV